MKYSVDFFKQDNKWYADIQNHILGENEMVFGSDTLLDYLSNDGSRMTIEFNDEFPENGSYIIHAIMQEHDNDGAFYLVKTMHGEDVSALNQTMWICNVTHDVCGEHPHDIYITKF